jgi:uncharacterized protein (TIGR02646 family)
MNPYDFNAEELEIIATLEGKKLSPREMWEDVSVKDLKLRLKKHYIEEQVRKCAYCQVEQHTSHAMVWDTEHIIDKNNFPQWTFEALNLCVSCKDCNQAKGVRPVTKSQSYKSFPHESENYYIVHAHFDNYADHIEIVVPGFFYLHITDKGRSTIETCGLLRYSKAGGRADIDRRLKAVLYHAANEQTSEALETAQIYILEKLDLDKKPSS